MQVFQDVQGLHILDFHSLADVMRRVDMRVFVRIQLQEELGKFHGKTDKIVRGEIR